jgi:hypothetical protein
MLVLRYASAVLLLLLAACASPHRNGTGSPPQRAAEPPSGYTLIATADTRDSTLRLEVNTEIWTYDDVLDAYEEDETLPFKFGHAFYWAVFTETDKISATGDGLAAESPVIIYSAREAYNEIRSALSVVTMRAPDRRNVVGTLLRSPDRRYILFVEFDTAGGTRSLYFDVTNWAKLQLEPG